MKSLPLNSPSRRARVLLLSASAVICQSAHAQQDLFIIQDPHIRYRAGSEPTMYDTAEQALSRFAAIYRNCLSGNVNIVCSLSDVRPAAGVVSINGEASKWTATMTMVDNRWVPPTVSVTPNWGNVSVSQSVDCDEGWSRLQNTSDALSWKVWCRRQLPSPTDYSCPVGNPTLPGTGTKVDASSDFAGPKDMALRRRYSSSLRFAGISSAFGNWTHSLDHRLMVYRTTVAGFASTVVIERSEGRLVFRNSGAGWKSEPGQGAAQLLEHDGPNASTWELRLTRGGGSFETYDASGRLSGFGAADGSRAILSYSDSATPAGVAPGSGYLISARSTMGVELRFIYDLSGQLVQVAPPGAVPGESTGSLTSPIRYAFEPVPGASPGLPQARLVGVTWQDGTSRHYHYEDARFPYALTGITDELGQRYATYSYNASGQVNSSGRAGGAFVRSFAYGRLASGAATTTVSEKVGNGATTVSRTISFLDTGSARLVANRSQPAGAGCDASTTSLTYDANGNVASKIDFNGTKSCHAHDLSRNLETARLEGLAGADACPADIAAQAISVDAVQRKTVTQWHPDWSLPVKKAEPGKITTNVYNGQPDPTAGNAVAACAPTTATLPDGKRIVVLCKKVEQATTDATGTLGFSAAPTGTPRTWTYTYNEHGQVLTARDPLNSLTTYAYHTETTTDYTQGDLKSVTNPAGHTTQYTRYDKSGRLLESVDANGTKTETTYTPRGWVKTVTTTPPGAPAQTTVYGYDGVGQLKKATLSDGTALEYTYDAAHRLRSIKDAAGNAVTYTLDNTGNRTGEELKDASGTLARNITRVYDALNRVQSATGTAQ